MKSTYEEYKKLKEENSQYYAFESKDIIAQMYNSKKLLSNPKCTDLSEAKKIIISIISKLSNNKSIKDICTEIETTINNRQLPDPNTVQCECEDYLDYMNKANEAHQKYSKNKPPQTYYDLVQVLTQFDKHPALFDIKKEITPLKRQLLKSTEKEKKETRFKILNESFSPLALQNALKPYSPEAIKYNANLAQKVQFCNGENVFDKNFINIFSKRI